MARKGGVPVDRVLNAMALPTLLRSLSQRRRSVGRAA
jgi:DNA polymerase (family X)